MTGEDFRRALSAVSPAYTHSEVCLCACGPGFDVGMEPELDKNFL